MIIKFIMHIVIIIIHHSFINVPAFFFKYHLYTFNYQYHCPQKITHKMLMVIL